MVHKDKAEMTPAELVAYEWGHLQRRLQAAFVAKDAAVLRAMADAVVGDQAALARVAQLNAYGERLRKIWRSGEAGDFDPHAVPVVPPLPAFSEGAG